MGPTRIARRRIPSFMQMPAVTLGDPKRRILKDIFGFDDFRPGQTHAIEAVLKHVAPALGWR